MKKIFIVFFVFICCKGMCQSAQTAPGSKQYYKVEGSGHVFECPVLVPRFTTNIKKHFSADSVVISSTFDDLYFISSKIFSIDSVRKVAVLSTIPDNVIKAIKVSTIPFPVSVNTAK